MAERQLRPVQRRERESILDERSLISELRRMSRVYALDRCIIPVRVAFGAATNTSAIQSNRRAGS